MASPSTDKNGAPKKWLAPHRWFRTEQGPEPRPANLGCALPLLDFSKVHTQVRGFSSPQVPLNVTLPVVTQKRRGFGLRQGALESVPKIAWENVISRGVQASPIAEEAWVSWAGDRKECEALKGFSRSCSLGLVT